MATSLTVGRNDRRVLHVAHWNIGTLRGNRHVSCETKIENLARYMDDNDIDILGLSETHILPNHEQDVLANAPGGKQLFLSNRPRGSFAGVALIVREGVTVEEAGTSTDPSRLLAKIVSWNSKKILVIEAYSPTDVSPKVDRNRMTEEEIGRKRGNKIQSKNDFYDNLRAMIAANRRNVDEVVLLGDFNAKTGWKVPPEWSHIIGNYPRVEDPRRRGEVPSTPSDNGLRLLDFCDANDLIITNNTYERPNSDKWTWESKTRTRVTNRVDFIIKTRDNQSALTVTEFDIHPDLYIGDKMSDHPLMRAKLRTTETDEEVHVAHWNIHTLRGHVRRNYEYQPCGEKMEILEKYMNDNGIDVLGLSATGILRKDNVVEWEQKRDPGQKRLFLSNRPAGHATGVGMLVRTDLTVNRVQKRQGKDPARLMGLIVTSERNKSILVIEACSPTDIGNKEEFSKNLRAMIVANRRDVSEVVLMGDFDADWDFTSSQNICQRRWERPAGRGSRIDFIIQRNRQAALTVEESQVRSGLRFPTVKSDHRLIRAVLQEKAAGAQESCGGIVPASGTKPESKV